MTTSNNVAHDDTIPDYLDAKFFARTLEHGLRLTNVKIINFNIKNITLGGENYCSNIYRATVKYHNEMEREIEIALIVKSMPKQKQGVLRRLDIYTKEFVFYLDIKTKMETLMWHAAEPWKLGAKYFYGSTEPVQTLVFEDLCQQDFMLQSRQQGLDALHARLVMQKLAEYHALTMTICQNEPDLIIDRYPFGLLNIDAIKADTFKALFGAQLLKLSTLIAEHEGYMKISQKLRKYHENFTARILKSIYPMKGQINVLNHGDLWVNNFLFKYDRMKMPTEVRLLDFQLCFYGSPGFDINYLLNTSMQLHVLQQQREQLIKIYFDALIRTLKFLPFKNALPKYEQIVCEIQAREAYGFFVAFGFFPLMSMVSIDSQDNTLERLHDVKFASQKIELMFKSNKRTMETLLYTLKRVDDLGLLD